MGVKEGATTEFGPRGKTAHQRGLKPNLGTILGGTTGDLTNGAIRARRFFWGATTGYITPEGGFFPKAAERAIKVTLWGPIGGTKVTPVWGRRL